MRQRDFRSTSLASGAANGQLFKYSSKKEEIPQHFICLNVLVVPASTTTQLLQLGTLFLSWNRINILDLDDKISGQNSWQPTSQFLRQRAHAGVFGCSGWRGMGKESSATLKNN